MGTDWIPFELMNAGQRSLVRWIHPGSEPLFVAPFFRHTVQTLLDGDSPQKLTPIDALLHVQPVKAPKGFIFHVSRCGSTLVSRSLSGVARHRVIAEPAPLNQLLLMENLAPGHKDRLLKGLIHALCGTAEDADCFIKFTSWNLLFLEQILALFPATPWLFIYRDPADVLQSLSARPPSWANNEQLARLTGLVEPSAAMAHLMAILERSFEAPLPHFDRRARAVSYAQLPAALPEITDHFGLVLSAAERAQIARIGQFDAKQPDEAVFRPRVREALQAPAAAMLPLNLLYEKWERIRTGAAPPTSELSRMAMRDEQHLARRDAAAALEDGRILDLISANRMPLPDTALLADIHRRRGDLAAAAAEFDRLHARGNTAPAVALFQAVFHGTRAPVRPSPADFAPAPFVIVDDVFDAETNRSMLDDAVSKEEIFFQTELHKADKYGKQQRNNLVTYDMGAAGETVRACVRQRLPSICECLNMPAIAIKNIQLKLAAYSHGDFFKAHQDNGEANPDRLISFVYYFHAEPKPYEGGDLLLYDSRFLPRAYVRSRYTRFIPRNNSMIFFPSEYFHEVLPVAGKQGDFRSCRFTMAGHVV